MFKKKGNKKEGYFIERTYTKAHAKITEPVMASANGEKQVLRFNELEMISDTVALGAISEEKFVIYELDNGESYSMLCNVVEFNSLRAFERFIVGVDLNLKEYVIFRKMEGCDLEKLKCRVRNNKFITSKDIMLFKCNNELKMLNFDCEKFKQFGDLAFMKGTLGGVRANWILDTNKGDLYKTVTSMKIEDVVSIDLREPYIIIKGVSFVSFAYIRQKNELDAFETSVIEPVGFCRLKEFFLGDNTFKRGMVFGKNCFEQLHLEGNVYVEGAILNINKRRYKLTNEMELELLTEESIREANKALEERLGLKTNSTHKNYFISDAELHAGGEKELKGKLIESAIFDDANDEPECLAEFLLNGYILQQCKVDFEKKEFTSNFSTPTNKVVKVQNGLSTHDQNLLFKTVYPRKFKHCLVFEELNLQKTLIVDLNKNSLARRTDMEFVMPVKNILIGIKDGELQVVSKGLVIKSDFIKFTPEGIMVMGNSSEGYYSFLIRDTGTISEITEDKFIGTDYYAVYDSVSWKNTYSKKLPILFEDRKSLDKMKVF